MSYEEANSERERINDELKKILIKEAKPWGIEIVRTEMKEIDPPKDVQSSMNEVIKAENTKNAAKDLAQAAETKADGERRAAIKVADGEREAAVLRANGEGQAIERIAKANAEKYKLENEALQKYFKNEAQIYKKLDVTENSLKAGTKYVIDKQTGITNVISDTAGVVPIPKDSAKKTRSKESEPDVTLVSEHSKEKTPMTMGRRR